MRAKKEVVVTFQGRLVSISFRGPGFDQIRLIAATIVVLHHCRGLQYPNIQNDPLLQYSSGYMDFGRFAVVIFFAISGFLVTPSLVRDANVVNYAVHRAVRIFPGLIVNVLLTMLLLGPFLTTQSLSSYFSDPDLYLYAKNMLTLMVRYLPGVVAHDGGPLIVNGALWTLHFEVLCYVALAVFGAVGLLRSRNLFLVSWFAFYVIYIAINVDPTIEGVLFERFSTFVSLFVFFGSGVLLYLFRERIPFSPILASAVLGLVIAVLPLGGGPVVMPICLPYFMTFCGLSFLPGKVLLRHDISYGVYLIHAPILAAFSLIFPSMHTWWIGAATVFLVTLVLAYFSWIFVEGPALKRKTVLSNWAHRCIGLVAPPFSTTKPSPSPAAE
jgi:peptidoglycan/LPS O-acetylase OafA/YrhL